MTDEARAITESIKTLRTLRVEGGRVSVDPCEVLEQPGYLEERARVGGLVRARQQQIDALGVSWEAVDRMTIEAFSKALALSLARSRQESVGVEQAITNLRYVLAQTRTSR